MISDDYPLSKVFTTPVFCLNMKVYIVSSLLMVVLQSEYLSMDVLIQVVAFNCAGSKLYEENHLTYSENRDN